MSFIYWCCREKGHGVHQGGQGQDQSRPFPPRGFCLGRSSRSWRRRGAQACRFSCSSSLEDRVHGRWPPSRASQLWDRDWRGSLVTQGLSSFLGFFLLSFSSFGFSPFFDFFLGLSWDPRPPRGAHSSPEASGVDPPGSPWVSASVASVLSCFCIWGSGGPGMGSGGPDGDTKTGGLGWGKTMWVLGVPAHLPTGPASFFMESSPIRWRPRKKGLPRAPLVSWVEDWAGPGAEGLPPPPPQPPRLKVSRSGLEDRAHPAYPPTQPQNNPLQPSTARSCRRDTPSS